MEDLRKEEPVLTERLDLLFDDLFYDENPLTTTPIENNIKRVNISELYDYNENFKLDLSKLSKLEVLDVETENNVFEEVNVQGLQKLKIFNAYCSVPLKRVIGLETIPNLEELSLSDIEGIEKYPNL